MAFLLILCFSHHCLERKDLPLPFKHIALLTLHTAPASPTFQVHYCLLTCLSPLWAFSTLFTCLLLRCWALLYSISFLPSLFPCLHMLMFLVCICCLLFVHSMIGLHFLQHFCSIPSTLCMPPLISPGQTGETGVSSTGGHVEPTYTTFAFSISTLIL